MNTAITQNTMTIVDALLLNMQAVKPVAPAAPIADAIPQVTAHELIVVNYFESSLALIEELKILAGDALNLNGQISENVIIAFNAGMSIADITRPYKILDKSGNIVKTGQQWKVNPLSKACGKPATFISTVGQTVSICQRAKLLNISTGTVNKPKPQSAIKKACEKQLQMDKLALEKIAADNVLKDVASIQNSIAALKLDNGPDFHAIHCEMVADTIAMLELNPDILALYRDKIVALLASRPVTLALCTPL